MFPLSATTHSRMRSSLPRHRRPILQGMSPARRLLGQMARYRRSFLIGFCCVVITSSIALAGPWVLKYAIDDLDRGVTMDKVRLYASALLLMAAVRSEERRVG